MSDVLRASAWGKTFALPARRPGVVRGARPERADVEEPFVARAVRQAVGRFSLPRRASRRLLAAWAARVEGAFPVLPQDASTRQ